MERMVPDSFHDRWNGRHWRQWALLAGLVLTGLAFALAAIVSAVLDENLAPLAFLFNTATLFILSLVGSGMLDGLTTRAISGGLARQPAEDTRADRPRPSDADRDRSDRRTIRAGLAALPVVVSFFALLLT